MIDHQIESKFSILNQVPCGMFVLAPDFTVLFWNDCIEQWTYLKRDKVIGTSIFDHFPELKQNSHRERILSIFKNGPPIIFSSQFHKNLINAPLTNSRQRLFNTYITAIEQNNQRDSLALFVLQDISDPVHYLEKYKSINVQLRHEIEERKLIEQELQLHRNNLEYLIEKRTEELKKTHNQLLHSEKLSALGKLVGSIAHEFNNPLYGLSNILEQLDENELLHGEEKTLLALGIKECKRMADLIKRLQEFYRPSVEKATLVDIGESLEELLLLIRKKMSQKKIKVEKNFAKNPPNVRLIEDQFKQVMLNIIQNSQESIDHEHGLIEISTEYDATNVKIKVKDNGSGISKDNMSHIFDPFFSTKGIKGTGLGLSISHEIVKKFGGDIEVESDLGKGSTFSVSLPLKTTIHT